MPDAPAETRAKSHKRPAYPRKRAVQACLTCRQRRTKCDNEKPSCSSCGKLGIQCVYQEFEKASFDAASLAILRRLDELETVVKNSRPEPQEQPALNFAETHFSAPNHFQSSDIEWVNSFEIRYPNVDSILNWPVFLASNLRSPTEDSPASRFDEVDLGSRPLLVSDVNADDASRLLRQFIDSFHVFNPVLDIPTLEGHVKNTSLNGFGWNAGSCLVLLVFALGATVGQDTMPPQPSVSTRHNAHFSQADAFFFAAQKRMGLLLSSSGIAEAQSFFLAGVYLMVTMRPADAWKMFARALASCHTFRPLSYENDSVLRLQQTVHWACYKSELELRLELSIVKTSPWDLRYPDLFPNPPESLESQGESAWYFYLAEIALRRLNNRILAFTGTIGRDSTIVSDKVTAIQEFERQAHSWAKSLPSSLRPAVSKNDDMTFPDSDNGWLRFILSGHMLDCLELMYWPFVYAAVHGTLGDDRDSHLLAARGLELCTQRIYINQAGFFHRHHGTWLMLRSCTRSALMLVAARKAELEDKLPGDWQACVGETIRLLYHWAEEVPGCYNALKYLVL